MRVLYDGWDVAYAPNSPASLHLFDLLSQRPAGIESLVALPAAGGGAGWLPEGVEVEVFPLENTTANRLRWEQRILPRLARAHAADLLHLMSASPALFGAPPTVISPTSFTGEPPVPRLGATARLRLALARGAHGPRQLVLWPDDLALPHMLGRVEPLPPLVPPDFNPSEAPLREHLRRLGLPASYVLYHGPKEALTLRWLLSAWSWVISALGDQIPLVLLGCTPQDVADLMPQLRGLRLGKSIYPLPPQRPDVVASLYRGSAAVFHPLGSVPWGGALRYALACAKPIVALETSISDALTGPAAYLVKERDTRLLGAALLTVLVEDEVAASLREAALERIRAWTWGDFGAALEDAYRKVLRAP